MKAAVHGGRVLKGRSDVRRTGPRRPRRAEVGGRDGQAYWPSFVTFSASKPDRRDRGNRVAAVSGRSDVRRTGLSAPSLRRRRRPSSPRGTRVIEVRLGDDDRIEWALKAFKRKVLKAGILKDVRKKRHYLKPSEARQLKAAAARRNARSKNRASR